MRLALSAGIVLLAASAVGTAGAATTFYVGIQGGYLSSKSDVRIPLYPSEFNLTSNGAEGGIFGGITMPLGAKWDLGIEGDFNLTSAVDTHLSGGGPPGELYRIAQKSNFSVRVLPGFWLTPTTQVFGEAGWRWASVDASYVPLAGGVKSADLSGYVLGIGLKEMIAPDWFVRGEYRYSSSDRAHVVHIGPSNFDLRSNEFLAGVGFTF